MWVTSGRKAVTAVRDAKRDITNQRRDAGFLKGKNMKDGGNAFPVGSDLGPASNICDGGYGGMTLRDYFAAKAMQGIMANHDHVDSTRDNPDGALRVAIHAHLVADAMLAERAKN